MHEWSLIAFTLLLQTAAGAFGILLIAAVTKQTFKTITPMVAAGLAVLGVIASILHLGEAGGFYRAAFNPMTSWLSREVWLTALFVALACWNCFEELRHRRNLRLLWGTTLLGLAAVVTSAMVYATTVQAAWAQSCVIGSFLASTCLLGTVLVAVFEPRNINRLSYMTVFTLGVLLFVVSLAYTPAVWRGELLTVQAVSSGLGIVAALWAMLRDNGKMYAQGAALLLLAAGQIAGRMVFYSLV